MDPHASVAMFVDAPPTSWRVRWLAFESLMRKIDDPDASRWSKWYRNSMIFMALLSMILISMSTTTGFRHAFWLRVFEHLFGMFLSFDLLVKYSVCRSTAYFFSNVYNGVDIVNVLPYIQFLFNWNKVPPLDLFYLLRIIFRLFKIMKYSPTIMLLSKSITTATGFLALPMFLLLNLVVGFACVIYFCERDAETGFFDSLVPGLWFGIVTVATVGYGDMYPVTWQGRVATSMFIILGLLYLAIPIGIIGGSFSDVWGQRNKIVELEKMRRRLAVAGSGPAQLAMAFNKFDKDCSGHMEFNEFKDLIAYLKLDLQEGVCRELFRAINASGTGNISRKEFQYALFPNHDWDEFEEEELQSMIKASLDALVGPLEERVNRIRANLVGSQ